MIIHSRVWLFPSAPLWVYGLPPYLDQVSSNSCSRISAPLFLVNPVSLRLNSHISRSFVPATRSRGSLSGCNSSWRAIHCPSKWAYHHPFLRFRRSCSEGRMNGTRKYLCVWSPAAFSLAETVAACWGDGAVAPAWAVMRRVVFRDLHNAMETSGALFNTSSDLYVHKKSAPPKFHIMRF